MSTPLVHVLVINWNGLEHLQDCFESLLAGTYANVKYILVDNGSDDDSTDFVREHYGDDERVAVLECGENLGWSGGNNVAMQRSLGENAAYILLLNNDTRTAPDAIEKLVAMAEERPRCGALAPKMVLFDQPDILNSAGIEASYTGSAWDRGIGRIDLPRWNTSEPVIGACGGACFLRTETLRRTGLLPEDFIIYLDDLDLCLRIWNAGYEIHTCPEARVQHKFSAAMGTGRRAAWKYYFNTRNRFRLVMRNYPFRRMPATAAALMLSECRAVGRNILDGAWERVPAHGRAWISALGYLPAAYHERRRRAAAGLDQCGFAHLIRNDRMFCPERLLPENGWYPEIEYKGAVYRPMARRAYYEHRGGALRVLLANCYPSLGVCRIRLFSGDRELASVATDTRETVRIDDAPPGRIEARSDWIFTIEDTGLPFDTGGWLAIESEI
jgi:GT2 family glycosyltransferase